MPVRLPDVSRAGRAQPRRSFSSYISPTVPHPTSAFSGRLLGDIANIFTLGTSVHRGQASEFVVYCFSGIGGTGSRKPVQTTQVTLSADGSSYSTSAGPAGSSKQASPVWHNAWFDGGLGIVVVGLVLALAVIYARFRKTARTRSIAGP